MRGLSLALVPTLLLGAGPLPRTLAPVARPAKATRAFPFPIHQRTLPNGLKVVVIPTGMPGLVSLQIPVSTGSRNEVEPGKSGFAHFFEHMMFRGTPTTDKARWNLTLQQTGASQNAYTSDDLTCYHTLCAKEDLETWLKLEADRFQHLQYPESEFKDESRAVLGEYNKNSSDPLGKLIEVQRDAAFTTHTYKHTTMGFLKDIEDMPNQFPYSLAFFRRWYRPDNATVVLVGDVDPATAFPMVEKHFGPWKRTVATPPAVPAEPPSSSPIAVHVPWDAPTLPWVSVAFHTPARFSSTRNDSVALDLAAELLFGPQSDLYQRLVVAEQKVDQLFTDGGGAKDPELFTILARVKRVEDMTYVRDAILDTCARALAVPFSATRLEEARTASHLAFLRSLDSTQRIASMVARMTAFDRDPEAINQVQLLEDGVRTADLARITKATFQDRNRVITTLCQGPLPASQAGEPEGVEPRAARLSRLPALAILEEPGTSPLVDLRLQFRAGSMDDPAGKEGLAALAAAMVAEAGTLDRGYKEVLKAQTDTASALHAQVDKELTTFSLTVPGLRADEALELALEQILRTGLRPEDFERLKTQQLNALKVGLKANNDEELGKLVLESMLYDGAYGHPSAGTETGLAAITLEDVRTFLRERYTRHGLRIGLAGGFLPAHKAAVLRGLGGLPEGGAARTRPLALAPPASTQVRIVTKETRATAISFGFPVEVDRRHPDFAALWVATSHLGEHRNSTARLYQRLREVRGLNYGDYAYLEPFPGGMFRFQPDPGNNRSINHFQIWIRPVAPQNAPFALKAAVFELGKLVSTGLDPKAFEASRTFLVKYLDHLTDTGAKRLGRDMEMAFFGLDAAFVPSLRARLASLTREEVNAAIRRHLRADRLEVAMITRDGEALRKDLLAPVCAPPAYQSPKPELKAEDEIIGALDLGLKPADVTLAPLADVFK